MKVFQHALFRYVYNRSLFVIFNRNNYVIAVVFLVHEVII